MAATGGRDVARASVAGWLSRHRSEVDRLKNGYNKIMGGGDKNGITLKVPRNTKSKNATAVYVTPMSPADIAKKPGGFKLPGSHQGKKRVHDRVRGGEEALLRPSQRRTGPHLVLEQRRENPS